MSRTAKERYVQREQAPPATSPGTVMPLHEVGDHVDLDVVETTAEWPRDKPQPWPEKVQPWPGGGPPDGGEVPAPAPAQPTQHRVGIVELLTEAVAQATARGDADGTRALHAIETRMSEIANVIVTAINACDGELKVSLHALARAL